MTYIYLKHQEHGATGKTYSPGSKVNEGLFSLAGIAEMLRQGIIAEVVEKSVEPVVEPVIEPDPVSEPISEITEFNAMTASELKSMLSDLGLPTYGKKQDLIDRLQEATK